MHNESAVVMRCPQFFFSVGSKDCWASRLARWGEGELMLISQRRGPTQLRVPRAGCCGWARRAR
jgi:hypothetical protein